MCRTFSFAIENICSANFYRIMYELTDFPFESLFDEGSNYNYNYMLSGQFQLMVSLSKAS